MHVRQEYKSMCFCHSYVKSEKGRAHCVLDFVVPKIQLCPIQMYSYLSQDCKNKIAPNKNFFAYKRSSYWPWSQSRNTIDLCKESLLRKRLLNVVRPSALVRISGR